MLYSAMNQEVIRPLLDTYPGLLFGLRDDILHWETADDRFGEISAFRNPVILGCSDGTVLRCQYRSGWWAFTPLVIGSALVRIQAQAQRTAWVDSIQQQHHLDWTDLACFRTATLNFRTLITPVRRGQLPGGIL